tara:strand:- start:160 stop:354 length:195 start_codon:yes stop_codon:yes gene_type:complete
MLNISYEKRIAAARFDKIHSRKVNEEEATRRALARYRKRPLRSIESKLIYKKPNLQKSIINQIF